MINGVFGQKGKSTDDDLGEEVTVIMSLKTFVNNEYYIQSKIDTSEKSDIYIEKLKQESAVSRLDSRGTNLEKPWEMNMILVSKFEKDETDQSYCLLI